jgi:hypothetical protein
VCSDGVVYNLEVEGNHNYFANGMLVHNCHHASATTYREVFDRLPSAARIGLTATPFRLDGKGLGDMFGSIVVAAWPDELCAAGTLHRPKVWATMPPDLGDVHTVAGDYNKGELANAVNTKDRNADIIKTWLKHAAGKRTVAFAVDVPHSLDICAAFVAAGVPAEHLDGKTPDAERTAILQRLARGVTLVVCNCMVLTEGWDMPSLECAIVARPTSSLNLHLQMIGRIMRACPEKQGCIVLDHAGNHHKHGLVTRRLEYSLDGAKKIGSTEPLGLRRCQACGLFYDVAMTCCPDCGWAPPAGGADRTRPEIHGDGELVELFDREGFVTQFYGHEKLVGYGDRQRAWQEIEKLRGDYSPLWSYYRYRDCFGSWPTIVAGELVDTGHATKDQKKAVYAELVRVAKAKGFKQGWASYRYKETFGCWPSGFVGEVREATP